MQKTKIITVFFLALLTSSASVMGMEIFGWRLWESENIELEETPVEFKSCARCPSPISSDGIKREFPEKDTVMELNDDVYSTIYKLSKGNPGALSVLVQIFKHAEKIDPIAFGGFLSYYMHLDSFHIYAHHIWMLYKDVCNENIVHTLAIIRARQMGIIDSKELYYAILNRGACVCEKMPAIFEKLKAELPEFNLDYIPVDEV